MSEPRNVDQADEHSVVPPTLLEQMGGISGLVYSTVPILVFVPANSFFGLTTAIWAACGVAGLILVWRLVRRENIQPAISGFLGVAISAFIAYRVGTAKGFFLYGIWTSLVYGVVLALSIVVRWPIVGVAWNALNGRGQGWRKHKRAVWAYDIATACWVAVFAARYFVQKFLYDQDETGLLGVARIAMGWPLAVVAFGVSVWAVKRADSIVTAAADDATADDLEPLRSDRP